MMPQKDLGVQRNQRAQKHKPSISSGLLKDLLMAIETHV